MLYISGDLIFCKQSELKATNSDCKNTKQAWQEIPLTHLITKVIDYIYLTRDWKPELVEKKICELSAL